MCLSRAACGRLVWASLHVWLGGQALILVPRVLHTYICSSASPWPHADGSRRGPPVCCLGVKPLVRSGSWSHAYQHLLLSFPLAACGRLVGGATCMLLGGQALRPILGVMHTSICSSLFPGRMRAVGGGGPPACCLGVKPLVWSHPGVMHTSVRSSASPWPHAGG